MRDLEIIAKLQYMQEHTHYLNGNPDKGFVVLTFNVDSKKPNISITTSLPETVTALPKKNFEAYISLWHEHPKTTAPSPKVEPVAAPNEKKMGVDKTPALTGESAKHPHITSDVRVYVTKDFKIFKHATGNRMLNKNKIKKIVHDITNGLNRLADYPILVDNNMKVLDGQHRLESAIQTLEYIYYIIARPMEMHQVARVNSNTERWKGGDFINCYISQGNKHYERLNQFMKDYKFPLSVCVKLLNGGTPAGGGSEMFQRFERGTFTTNDKHLIAAVELAELVSTFSDFSSALSGPFIAAVHAIKVKGLCDWDHLLEKYKKKPEMLKPNSNKKQYITDLELIYNHNAQKRTIIF